jgi:hypothetical protein
VPKDLKELREDKVLKVQQDQREPRELREDKVLKVL